jgi:ATP/maltotriose-dependent transcriptional regulator MalT
MRMAYEFWIDDEIALPLVVYCNSRDELISNGLFDDQRQERVYHHFLELFRERNQPWGAAFMLYCLGSLYCSNGQVDEAERYCRESKDAFLRMGDRWGALWADNILWPELMRSGRYNEALQLLQNHEDVAIELGQGDAIVFALTSKAEIAWKQKDDRAARQYIAQGINSSLKTGSHFLTVAVMFFVLVDVLVSEDRHEQAVELLSFLRQEAKKLQAPDIVYEAGQKLDALAGQVAPEIYQQFIGHGKTLNLKTILAQLLDELAGGAPPLLPTLPPGEPLSQRELEVLRLLAAGHSNRQITRELVLSLNTVKSHIHHIYGKLGVESRTQAIAQAQKLNLL